MPVMPNKLRIRGTKRYLVLLRDGMRCVYCGEIPEIPQIDHITPRKRHVNQNLDNLVTSCPQCNAAKGDKPLPKFVGKKRAQEIRNQAKRSVRPWKSFALTLNRMRVAKEISSAHAYALIEAHVDETA